MNLFNYNATFKPQKKSKEGTIRYELHKAVADKFQEGHTSSLVFEVIQLPKDTDINEWYAVHVIEFYNKVNFFFGGLYDVCNCKEMAAGKNFSYLWKDKGNISLALDWIETLLNDDKVFPQGGTFPKDYEENVSKIMTRILRIYAHIFYEHYREIQKLEMDKQLNIYLKHFVAFVYHFDLVPVKELDVLKDWCQTHLNVDISKKKKKIAKVSNSGKDSASLTIDIFSLQVHEEVEGYFSMQFGQQEEKTEVKKNHWNETFTFLIKDVNDKNAVIRFTWFEKSLLSFREVGSFDLLIHKYFDEKQHDEWLDLRKKDKIVGSLNLKLKFTSAMSGTMKYLSELTNVQFYRDLIKLLAELTPSQWIYLFDNSFIHLDEKIYTSILYVNQNSFDLMKQLIDLDVASCVSASTLFRANTICTKMLNSYTKMIGTEYLIKMLDYHIRRILSDDIDLEVDPSKASPDAHLYENMDILVYNSNNILQTFFGSLDEFPKSLSAILSHVCRSVMKRFEDDKVVLTALTGCVMLRFVCPSIVSPELTLQLDTPTQKNRRTLTLISKIIQNLSNDVLFKDKEQFMTGANDFIVNRQPDMKKFLFDVAKENEFENPKISEQRYLFGLYSIHDFLYQNQEKMKQSFLKGYDKKFNNYPIENIADHQETFEKVWKVLDKLGKPAQLTLDSRQKITSSKRDNLQK